MNERMKEEMKKEKMKENRNRKSESMNELHVIRSCMHCISLWRKFINSQTIKRKSLSSAV